MDKDAREHPDYETGYFAGLRDQFHRGDSPEYEAGYAAGSNARELFVRNGFRPTRDGFIAKFSMPPAPPRKDIAE